MVVVLRAGVLSIEEPEAPVLGVGPGDGGGGGGLVLVIVRHHAQSEGGLVGPDGAHVPGVAVQVGAVAECLTTVSVPGVLGVVWVSPAPTPGDHHEVLPALGVADIDIVGVHQDGSRAGGAGGERTAQGEVSSGVLTSSF